MATLFACCLFVVVLSNLRPGGSWRPTTFEISVCLAIVGTVYLSKGAVWLTRRALRRRGPRAPIDGFVGREA